MLPMTDNNLKLWLKLTLAGILAMLHVDWLMLGG